MSGTSADHKSLRVEVTEQPGLQALLAGDEPPPDAELRQAADLFVTTPGVEGTAVSERVGDAIRSGSQATAKGLGWWDNLRRWLAGERQKVVGSEEHEIELVAYWLTVPGVAGAKVTLSSSATSSDETSASFTIAGIGGGPTFSLALKEDVKFDSARDLRVAMLAKATFEKVQVTRDGRPIATYARLASLDRDNLVWTVEPASPPDPTSWGSPTWSRRFQVSLSTGTLTDTLTVTRGTTWDVGADLSLDKIGLKAKLGSKVTYEGEVECAYELPGGHDYLAVRYPAFPAFLWTVDPT